MIYAIYIAVFLATIYLSQLQSVYRISKASVLVGGAGAVLASPFLLATAIVSVLILQWALFAVVGILFLITKWKIFLLFKLQMIVVTVFGVTLTLPSGGLIWLLVALIFVVVFLNAIKTWPKEIYAWTRRFLSGVAAAVRKGGNFFRRWFWVPGWIVAAIGEFALICTIPMIGLWSSFGLLDKSKTDLPTAIREVYATASYSWHELHPGLVVKLGLTLLYGILVYLAYLRGTRDVAHPSFEMDAPDIVLPKIDGEL